MAGNHNTNIEATLWRYLLAPYGIIYNNLLQRISKPISRAFTPPQSNEAFQK